MHFYFVTISPNTGIFCTNGDYLTDSVGWQRKMILRSRLRKSTALLIFTLMLMFVVTSGCMYFPRTQPLLTKLQSPELTKEAFFSSDGYKHPYRQWIPKKQRIDAVIIGLHGFNDYSNAYTNTGMSMSEKGIAVYAYDQRGFGETERRGTWHGTGKMVLDLRQFIILVKKRHGDVPVYALGDSMGGAIVLAANAAEPLQVEGTILVAPAVWAREIMPWYQRVALWMTANTVPWLKVSGKGLDITPSDNHAMLIQLSKDPLVIKETRIDAIWGLTNLMDAGLRASSKLNCPTLVLYGKKDEIIPEKAIRMMINRLPKPSEGKHKIALYENGYHMLLRDLKGDAVATDIYSWIMNRAAALPSKADMTTFDDLNRKG